MGHIEFISAVNMMKQLLFEAEADQITSFSANWAPENCIGFRWPISSGSQGQMHMHSVF